MRKILFCILILNSCISCKNYRPKKVIVRDTTITQKTSFNNLFLDSTQLHTFIAAHPAYEAYTLQFIDFYKHRNYQYAWFDAKGLIEQAQHFMNLQQKYISDFEDSSLYNAPLINNFQQLVLSETNQDKAFIQQTELALTGDFFRYAAKVYNGSDIDVTELGWLIPRKKIDLSALLDSTMQTSAMNAEAFVPLNSQYKKLFDYFKRYAELEQQNQFDSLPELMRPIRSGDRSPLIPVIRSRLLIFGDLNQSDSSDILDSTLIRGVQSFQARMGLAPDGVIGNKMIAALNIPLQKRIEQLLINLERMRWMPPEKDSQYIQVNIPEFKMHVYDSGRLQFTMNVIVGSAANNTVIFNNKLKYIVFSPYWNIPESIVLNEILPAMKKNPGYLVKNNMEIVKNNNSIPIIRQNPGPHNSLGLVKFIFPNEHNIYFHDTPNRGLFTRDSRDMSHGCIRLGEPVKFANYLLRNQPDWTPEKIDSAMHLSREKWVSLKKGIPVLLVYFTAWVDNAGKLNFREDIYKHDERMRAKLFNKE